MKTHVQSQTHYGEFDLSFWLKFNVQLPKHQKQKHAGSHVQRQTHDGEFDLGLTKLHYSIRKQRRSACAKLNLVC